MAGGRRWSSLLIVACLLIACSSAADQGQSEVTRPKAEFTDFATLAPPDRPNHWLIAPIPPDSGAVVAAKPDAVAPVFAVAATRLAQDWIGIVNQQPRTVVLAVSGDGLQVEAEQKSAVFGFRDRISARFVPLDGERSTLIAYSASEVGYWDLGVNRDRLTEWIDLLVAKVGAGG